eukprot:15360870-Ditylum_brightwellii.AAC.1
MGKPFHDMVDTSHCQVRLKRAHIYTLAQPLFVLVVGLWEALMREQVLNLVRSPEDIIKYSNIIFGFDKEDQYHKIVLISE